MDLLRNKLEEHKIAVANGTISDKTNGTQNIGAIQSAFAKLELLQSMFGKWVLMCDIQ